MKFAGILLSVLAGASPVFAATGLELPGPDGSLTLSVSLKENRAGYTLQRGQTPLLQWAPLGIVLNETNSGENVSSLELLAKTGTQEKTFPVNGVHATGKVSFVEYNVGGLQKGQTLRVRVFNDGVAFRYEFPEGTGGHVKAESTGFGVPEEAVLWTQDGKSALGPSEGVFKPVLLSAIKQKNAVRSTPILAALPGGDFLFFQEAGSFGIGWSGIKLTVKSGDPLRTVYYHDPKGFHFPDKSTHTPWRVVLAARDLNTLVNSDIVQSLVPAPDATLFPNGPATDWIKPGRSTWSWWSTTRADYRDQIKFADLAGELGYEYHLIDEGWEQWQNRNTSADKWTLLRQVVEHAAKKNVKIWVWKRWNQISNTGNDWAQMKDFFDKLKATGVVGIKIDFMDSQSQSRIRFYDAVLRHAAARKLMINFHGANTPSGEEHTWPNGLTREGIFGLEQNIWGAIGAEHYCALPFTRLVAGSADFTPGYFGHDPKRLDNASWTLQLAALIVYTSPIQHIVSPPGDLRAAAPAATPQREVLKSLPAVWDETRVLPGAEVGKFAPFARRKNDVWFVGILNGRDQRETTLKLDFLSPGKKYNAIIITDEISKNDAWKVATREVKATDSVNLTLRSSGGAVLRLTPAD
ncbi:MAG: glycoside hydrolase family 97 protein [Puniceicoccales bacterium]|jgi:alpha-glucosidase|nr:glycoside hydrolase family 97 protein [Puniceicoccales bacterium]